MKNSSIVVICGDPKSTFNEILIKTLKKKKNLKFPVIIVGSKRLLENESKKLKTEVKDLKIQNDQLLARLENLEKLTLALRFESKVLGTFSVIFKSPAFLSLGLKKKKIVFLALLKLFFWNHFNLQYPDCWSHRNSKAALTTLLFNNGIESNNGASNRNLRIFCLLKFFLLFFFIVLC